jgi:hypothetical protein
MFFCCHHFPKIHRATTLRSYLIVQIFDEKTMIRCKDPVMRAQYSVLTPLTAWQEKKGLGH